MSKKWIEVFKAGNYSNDPFADSSNPRVYTNKEIDEIIENYDIKFRSAPLI